jgi:acyl carrier protein
MDIDSIDAVEIIMAIEDEFEVEIPDDVAESFTTIADIITYLNSIDVEG